jgi:predicted transcriptional regulator
MRTTLLLGILLATALATPTLGEPLPAPVDVEQTLEDLRIQPPTLDGSNSDPAADGSSSSDRASSAVAVATIVVAPVETLSRSLVELGLSLLGGFVTGVSSGAATFVHAASVTAATPLESVAIAAATLAVAGLATLLGLAIQRYGGLGAIPLFSRIARDDLFENKIRADIFELIRANPGVNVSEISRRLDVAWGTATHHLQKLRGERMVSVRVVGHQKCYFPNGGTFTPREMDVMGATKNSTAKRIAEFVAQTGPTPHRAVAQALGLSPALVSFHARKLEEAGVVGRRREGRRTVFIPLEANLTPTPRPSVHSL